MNQFFTEEEYKQTKEKYKEFTIQEIYSKENYNKLNGYIDLRELNLSDREFEILWKCQDLLNEFDSTKHQLNENICIVLDSLKNSYNDFFRKEV